MKQEYINYIIIVLTTLILCSLFFYSMRYEINKASVSEGRSCLIQTNLMTGTSCMIGGSRRCHLYNFGNIEYCSNVKKD